MTSSPKLGDLDVVLKGSAILLTVVYATGFLVVSVHLGIHGISQFSLLKPKILSAGLLFVILTVAPILSIARLFGIFEEKYAASSDSPVESRMRIYFDLIKGAYFFHVSFVFAILFSVLSARFSFLPWKQFRDGPSFERYGIAAVVVFYLTLLFVPLTFNYVVDHVTKFPARATLCAALSAIALATSLGVLVGGFLFNLTLWFYVIGVVSLRLYSRATGPSGLRELELERLVPFVFVLVFVYSVSLYPSFHPAFGGGAPTPIRIHLVESASTRIMPCQRTMLIEETKHGYFLQFEEPEPKYKGLFVDRNQVTAIEFGPEQADCKEARVDARKNEGEDKD